MPRLLTMLLSLLVLQPDRVQAQQHRATRLGNPATRFAEPLRTPQDLRRLFASEALRGDVDYIARESGFQGDLTDLRQAAASAVILELKIPVGTRLPAMSSRERGKPVLLRDVLWAGKEPIDAYEFYFASHGRRYRVVTPKACANFWIEDYGRELRPVLVLECNAPAEMPLRRATEVCLTIRNTGDASEPKSTVTLPVPAGATFISATGGGKPTETGLVWELVNLSPGGSSSLCATFSAPQAGELAFVTTVRGQQSPPMENRCVTRVVGVPAILLEVVDLADPIEVGQDQTYEIMVLNQGTAVLTNIKLVCTLPESQQFVSGSGASAVRLEGRSVTMDRLPTLQPKEKASWRVVVKTLRAGDERFTTELTCDQFPNSIMETESTRQY